MKGLEEAMLHTLTIFLLLAASASAPQDARSDVAARRAALAARAEPQDAPAQDEGPTYASLQSLTEFTDLVARDRRVSFGPRTRAAALREFDRLSATDAGKAAALVALGCAQVHAERSRLESYAREAPPELRQAAILALGEMRSSDVGLLTELTGRKAVVADYALFALVRNGGAAARASVESIASQSAHPLNGAARDALGFLLDPPVESPVATRFLELRFDAARRFGLVDEQAWTTLLVDDLTSNQKFLSRVVYRAAADLSRPGIKDHFLEVALAGGPPERLRGVVRAIPAELARVVDEELFRPADAREWTALLDEIDRHGLERLCEPILRRAWMEPALRVTAASLLARAKAPGALELVELGLRLANPYARLMAAHALSYTPSERSLALAAALELDEDPRVRGAARVTQFRLGSDTAGAYLRDTLEIDATLRVLSELRDATAKPAPGEGRGGARGGAARSGGGAPERGAQGKVDAAAERAQRSERAAQATARLTPLPREALELVEAMVPDCSDRRVRDLLAVARFRLPDGLRMRVDSELAFYGDARARVALREALLKHHPKGAVGARAVQALARGAGLADVEVVRELFPVGDDLDVDVELALALIGARDAAVQPILRAALWSEPWNRSVLAGALIVAQGGVEALRGELSRPPKGVTDRDLRRVGFALGEWGGASEVDRLAGRVGAADPALQGALLGALAARTR